MAELALRPTERHADRVRCQFENGRDLPRFESLPCPEPDDLGFAPRQCRDRCGEFRIVALHALLRVVDGAVDALCGRAFDESQAPLIATTVVGEASSRGADAPGERFWREVVEPSPDHEQRVGEHVGGIVGPSAAAEISLERFVDLGRDGLETGASIGIDRRCARVHSLSLSGTDRILSPVSGPLPRSRHVAPERPADAAVSWPVR